MTEHKTDMIITRIEKKKRNGHNRTKNRHEHY